MSHTSFEQQSQAGLSDLHFLLDIIKNTDSNDSKKVAMRKMSFGELIRANQVAQADSRVLKVYAKDEKKLYGKTIQCAAMKELANRTQKAISLQH